MSLHEELVAARTVTCKLCLYLRTLDPAERAAWQKELRLPVRIISHTAVVNTLERAGLVLDEKSVRRHRRNHS